MIKLMEPKLEAWEDSELCNVVLLKSEGRAFCAGGDVVALVNAARKESTRQTAVDYFRAEYTLDRFIARMSKPVVAVMDGITMGGGIGLAGHVPFRIATERTKMSMPETTIGLFPDVGASFFLSRLDGKIGQYLGLTSETVDGWTAYQIGFASHYVPSSNLASLEDRLAHLEKPSDVETCHELINTAINESSIDSEEAKKLPNLLTGNVRQAIDACFRHDTVEAIVGDLKKLAAGELKAGAWAADSDVKKWAIETSDKLALRSPTSCVVTLEAIRRGADSNIDTVFETDMRIACACVDPTVAPDFVVGVTERLIEKKPRDVRPDWKPAQLSEVKRSEVKRVFFDSPAPMKLPVPELGPSPRSARGQKPRTTMPHARFSLPTEAEISLAVTCDKPYDSSRFAPTEPDVVKQLEKRFGPKAGLRQKVTDVISRKTTKGSDGTLSWT